MSLAREYADHTATRWDRFKESAVRLVSPKRAMLMEHSRRMANDATYAEAFDFYARQRGYKAAETTKGSTPWLRASDRTADGEIVPGLPTMRNRSRAARRDDSVAVGIFNAFTTNIVGTGRTPQPRVFLPDGSPDTVKAEALDAVWWERADKLSPADGGLTHAQHQALVLGKKLEDGDVLLREAKRTPDEPVWIETIEGQRLRTPAGAMPQDRLGRIVNGIEKDRHGHTVAYWVSKTDPGDTGATDTVGATPVHSLGVADFDRVPAGPGVCFVRRGVNRPGQSRGVPLLHACLQDVLDLDLLFLAALKRTQLAACLALFIKSPADDGDLLEMTAADYGYELDQKIKPGMIWRLFPGEEVTPVSPGTPFADLSPLFMLAARRIGASVGLSPQTILRIWENINYSGARTILLDDRNTYRVEGYAFDVEVMNWEWRAVQQDALLRGDARLLAAGVTLDDVSAVEWIGDGEPWVDPVSEAQATQLKLSMKLTTFQRECARLGCDWRQNLREHVEAEVYENELRAKKGLAPAMPLAPLKLMPKAGDPDAWVEYDDEEAQDEDEPAAKEAA